MKSPILTILVPNRGRSKYLDITLSNLSEISDKRIEIVILENSEPEYHDTPWDLPSETFRVEKSTTKLSMTKNWHRGIGLARGEWICYLGSDDGIVAGNVSKFLDFLETEDTDVVGTHPIYFQYPLPDKESWADLPTSNLDDWSKQIRYIPILSAIFPQMKLDLPIPYNRSVVRTSILRKYAQANSDILGVSPDDFLGQYIAQKCKVGKYLELPVFIHGGSERSNGLQVGSQFQSNDAFDFISDSTEKFDRALARFSIACSFALAAEHYLLAGKANSRRIPKISLALLMALAEFSCTESSHHSRKLGVKVLRATAIPIHTFSYRVIRKIWILANFGCKSPVQNRKVKQPSNMDVIQLSRQLTKSIESFSNNL